MAVNPKRRLAAVVVADVVDYSKLVGDDEASAVAAVNARWETVLKPIVHENGGRVVKFLGDGALMEFSSAVDAVWAALAIQEAMSDDNASAPDAPAIQLRIGINLGDVISEGDDIFGDDVNIAARLEGVARPGELCVSQSVHDAVRGRLAFKAEEIGDLDLKNIAKPIRAFRLRTGDMPASTAVTSERQENRLSIAVQGMVELNKCTEESVECAGELFSLAIKTNPRYAKAHAKSCWVHIYKINFGWTEDSAASLRTALQFAEAAVAADDSEAWGYWAIAGCDMQQGRHDRAISGMTRAVELNPNDADVLADMGLFLSYVGRAEEGVPFALKANRINPNHPEYYDDQLGQVFFTARRYEDAVRSSEGIRNHITAATMVYLAASHAALGNMESAGAAVKELLAKEPSSTIETWTSPDFIPYKNPDDIAHLALHLRAAGVPGCRS